MATLTQIGADVRTLLASKITLAEAEDLVQQAFGQIWDAYEWSVRKVDALVAIVADYTTGTVTATPGSATLAGASTVWTSAMVGRWIRIGSVNELYKITAFTSTTDLTIESPTGGTGWQGATQTAASYTLFQHIYTLASDVEIVLLPTRDMDIQPSTREMIDRIDPYRTSTGIPIRAWAPRELTSTGVFQIEFWPRPNVDGVVRVPYLKKAPTLATSDAVYLREDVVKYLAVHTGCLYLTAKHGSQMGGINYSDLAEKYWRLYFGDPTDKKVGALETAIQQDQQKYGQVTHLSDRTQGRGYSDAFLSEHDMMEF